MVNQLNRQVSIPVEILGLPDAPMAGDEVLVVNDEKKAREVADARADRERQKRIDRQSAMRLENIILLWAKKMYQQSMSS